VRDDPGDRNFGAMNTTRRLDLDWIRIAAFGLLIAYHVGMYYVTWDWHIKSPFASNTLEPLMLAVNPWRMSLLFVISGCATAFMLRRADGVPLLRVAAQRSRFLLVPLVFGMIAVVPPRCHWGECSVFPTWNHLWFVVYLWVYTMLLLPVHARLRSHRGLDGWELLVWPWLWLTFARIALFPLFGATHALVDDGYNHAQYFAAFLVGHMIADDGRAWDWLVSKRVTLLALAVGAYAAFISYAIHYDGPSAPPESLRVVMRGVYALLQWSAVLAVLAWGRRLLGSVRDTPARAYLTDAVFCYYIVHQTVIIGAAHALRPLGLRPLVEGPLLIAITAATCALTYELARRSPLLQPLFGIRNGLVDRNRILRYRTSP
jgi:hypothetical protein